MDPADANPQLDENAPLTEAELRAAMEQGEHLIAEAAGVTLAEAARPLELPEEALFDDKGRAKGVVIRPCKSRGRRIRGLPPIYTGAMLGEHAAVFTRWPMFIDHAPARVSEALAEVDETTILRALRESLIDAGMGKVATQILQEAQKRGVRDLGGQVMRSFYGPEYTREEDAEFGHQPGAVLAEYWATPFIRGLAGENPHLFETSINAWPTGGKPGDAPWGGGRGMLIAGIRSRPIGSWDFVVRGGAGGKLSAEDEELMVSVAESVYAPRRVQIDLGNLDLGNVSESDLRGTLVEKAPELARRLGITAQAPAAPAATGAQAPAPAAGSLTEADVQRMIDAANSDRSEGLSEDEVAEKAAEMAEGLMAERDEQRGFAAYAAELIEKAEGLGETWKRDLKARFAFTPDGPALALTEAIEEADEGDEKKAIEKAVEAEVDHARDLIAEATGKPRVQQEGGSNGNAERSKQTGTAKTGKAQEGDVPYWRTAFVERGIAESEDDAARMAGVAIAEEGD